jgi:DNA-binding Lrp family transcriptional regulator
MKFDLDRIDFVIVAALQKNVRLSNKELAARAGLAPSSCLHRIQRLRAAGVLLGAHAEVSPEALGIGLQALVSVKLREHSRPRVASFWRYARSLAEVLAVYHVSGSHDFLVHVAARDAHHLRDLAMDLFTARPEVAQIETSLIFEMSRNPVLPDYASPEGGKPRAGEAGRKAGRQTRERG